MQKGIYLLSILLIVLLQTACKVPSEQNADKQTLIPEIQNKEVKLDCDEITKNPNYNPFESVKIDKQEWTINNLNVDTFKNGDSIMEAQTDNDWRNAGTNGIPAWCYYNNNACNAKYGKLYNFHAVNDPRGLALNGWHVPSDEEWIHLTNFLAKDQGLKLKSQIGWFNNGNGDNSTGFNAKPGGIRYYDGEFFYYGEYGFFWTTTRYVIARAQCRYIREDYSDRIFTSQAGEPAGISVRLIKD